MVSLNALNCPLKSFKDEMKDLMHLMSTENILKNSHWKLANRMVALNALNCP
jgi:hypothetical protein